MQAAVSRNIKGGRRMGVAWLLALALLGAMPRSVWAHNVDGKAGIGLEETLTAISVRQVFPVRDASGTLQPLAVPDVRASGLSARYYMGNIGIEAITGASVRLPATGASEFGVFLSLGASYNLFRAPSVNLSVGARVLGSVARANQGDTAGPLRWGFAVEAPLRVEYFFSPNFAIGGAIGPAIAINGSQVNPLTGSRDSLDIALTRGDFSGGVGFTYYLN